MEKKLHLFIVTIKVPDENRINSTIRGSDDGLFENMTILKDIFVIAESLDSAQEKAKAKWFKSPIVGIRLQEGDVTI